MKKKIPALRFPGFEENWEENTLRNISTWASGGTPSKDISDYWNGELPWITASSMRGSEFSDSELKITEEGLNRGSKLALKGSILILVRGSMLFNTIPVGIATRDVAFNQDVKAITIIEKSTPKFILFWFKFSENILLNMVVGTGIGAGKLELSDLKNMRLYLPTLPEQQKIAGFLTSVDEKINRLTRKKTLLEQYKKGVMQQIFAQDIRFKDDEGKEFPEWKTKMLRNLVKYYDGTHQTPNYSKTGVPFYSVENVTANDFRNTKFISRTDYEKERVKPEKGDILMTRIGDIGTPKYINWDVEASFYVSLVLIKQSYKINSMFLSHHLSSTSFQKELHKRTIHVAFPKKINLGEIGNCLITFPCIEEQQKIADFLTGIDKKIEQVDSQLETTKQWKRGLLQQLFV